MNEINLKIIYFIIFWMELLHENRIFKTKKYISTKEISYKPHYGVENMNIMENLIEY